MSPLSSPPFRLPLGSLLMGALVAALMVIPLLSPGEENLNLVSLILIWSLFAIGFDLVFGVAGLLSFGHAALFGIGGYALTLLTLRLGWPFPLALLAGGALGAGAAFVFSLFALRASGIFFSLLTLALAQMAYILAGSKLRALTGGLDGIPGVPRPQLFGLDFYSGERFYLFICAVFLLGLGLAALLRASAFGAGLRAVQANDVRAAQLGLNVQRLRQAAFMVSGFYAGVSGGLLASLLLYVSPQMLHWSTSGEVVIMTLLGGKGTLLGPVLGTALFELLKEKLSQVTEHWYGVLGIIFVLTTLLLPRGIAGLFGRLDKGGAP